LDYFNRAGCGGSHDFFLCAADSQNHKNKGDKRHFPFNVRGHNRWVFSVAGLRYFKGRSGNHLRQRNRPYSGSFHFAS